MIQPTVGRIVWYHPNLSDPGGIVPGTVQAAIIAHVWNDSCVNLGVFDPDGLPYSRTSVYLQQDEGVDQSLPYATWMPYQKGQAVKTEELEAKRGGTIGPGLVGEPVNDEAPNMGTDQSIPDGKPS